LIERCGVTRLLRDWPGWHCSRAKSSYPQPSQPRQSRVGAARFGVKVITRAAGCSGGARIAH